MLNEPVRLRENKFLYVNIITTCIIAEDLIMPT